jgi:hypothetical protein
MSFWQLNKKKVILLFTALASIEFAVLFCAFHDEQIDSGIIIALSGSTVMMLLLFLVFCLPAMQAFRFIDKLTSDESELSILPLLDKSYTVSYQNISSWLSFATPIMEGTIHDLPAVIRYVSGSKYTSSSIRFEFTPLKKANSKRIYGEWLFLI